MCACMGGQARKGHPSGVGSFLHLMCLKDRTQDTTLSTKCPYSLSYLASPTFLNSSIGNFKFLLHTSTLVSSKEKQWPLS